MTRFLGMNFDVYEINQDCYFITLVESDRMPKLYLLTLVIVPVCSILTLNMFLPGFVTHFFISFKVA